MHAKQVFKVTTKDYEGTAEKGMDFAWYVYNWLLSDLYPYYWKVCKNNPDCDVYLVEDNSGAHTKARQHLAGHPLQRGINFAPQPGNSPDLHPIERCFDALHDAMEDFKPSNTSIAEKSRAKEAIYWHRRDAEMISSRIEAMCDNSAFESRATKCIKSKGYNFFHG